MDTTGITELTFGNLELVSYNIMAVDIFERKCRYKMLYLFVFIQKSLSTLFIDHKRPVSRIMNPDIFLDLKIVNIT